MIETLAVISVNLWQILISLANLLLLFYILKKFLFERVKKILAERKEQVDKIYTNAQDAQKHAEEYRGEYEARLTLADGEAETILRSAKEKADKLHDDIVAEANAESSNMIKRADAQIAQEKKKAINQMKDEISSVSLDIARKMIGRELSENDHKDLIDAFIDDISE